MASTNFDSTELPVLQSRTHCVLIPRDPNFIYAYWDYTEEDINRLRNQAGIAGADFQLILRVYDTTFIKFNGKNANHTWDLDVGYSVKNWYIHVWQDNADYCAELGVRCGNNQFIALMRSNVVRTPPKTASSRNDLIWQDIKEHKESRPYLKENIKERYQALMHQKSGKKVVSVKKLSRSPRIYQLTAQDICDYYKKLFVSVSSRARGSAQEKIKNWSIEDVLKGLPIGISWQKVQSLFSIPNLIKKVHPGASGEFLESKGASENLSGLQSGASEGRLNERKFFFEIWTELTVHGRTEPDAAVWLNQKGIKLNPDGTFTLRFALPDGEIPLKFIAQSSDGVEQRHILTSVEREKTIGFPKMLKDFNG